MTCHLVPRIPPPAAAGAASRLAAALAASTEARPDKRLLALVTLYNAAYDPASKTSVLLEALRYARSANLADIMLPVIRAHADGWARELGLDASGERALYTACADTLAGVSRKPRTAAREAYRLLCKCLATYEVGRQRCMQARKRPSWAAGWAGRRGSGEDRQGQMRHDQLSAGARGKEEFALRAAGQMSAYRDRSTLASLPAGSCRATGRPAGHAGGSVRYPA